MESSVNTANKSHDGKGRAQAGAQDGGEMTETECQERDSALAYIVISIDSTCKAMLHLMRCSHEVIQVR